MREGFKAELGGHGFIPLPVGLALPKGTELCVDRNNAAWVCRGACPGIRYHVCQTLRWWVGPERP